LQIREPDWFDHRRFKGQDPSLNLHVFSTGYSSTEQMLLLRDWLRGSDADRDLYARAKRELAGRDWKHMQQYADARGEVVANISRKSIASPV
jgi:GrpB-like predicted nucleotidyltransferase (UPF0157 family)